MLEKGCGITVVDHQTVVAAHGIDDAGQGDVVLFRTSRDSLWKNSRTVNKGAAEIAANNAEFGTGAPDTPNRGLLSEQYLMNKGSRFTFPFFGSRRARLAAKTGRRTFSSRYVLRGRRGGRLRRRPSWRGP